MSILHSRAIVIALATAGWLASLCAEATACGLNWSEPKSHFEGVSFQGYVFLVETLGEIDLKDGKKLPVRAIFRSESNSTSPYLGHGWELPILESHIVQMDEKWFRMVEPTGWYRLFWRDEKDPTVLHGQGNWKGVIRGNSISVMADCGDRLDFRDGRITAMHIKGQKLDVERSPDGTASLKEGASTLLTIQKSLSKEEIGLKFGNGETAEIGYANRPVIEVIAGQPVVRQQVKSLGSVARENGETRAWEYAVDEKLNPTMNIGNRLIVWNPATRYAISDGEWTYDIKPDENPRHNAAIARASADGAKEFWHRNRSKGEEIVQGIDEVRKVTTWFTSGKLAGKVRKREEIVKGVSKVIYQASYNEKGKLLREILENGEVNQFVYAEDGNPTTKTRLTKAGEPKDTVEYQEGRKAVVRSSDGRTTQYFYDDQGRETKMLINGNLHSEKSNAPGGSWRKVVVYSPDSGKPARPFFTGIDDHGRALSERITEHSGDYLGISKDNERNFSQKRDGTVEYTKQISPSKVEVFIVKNGKTTNWQLIDLTTGDIIKNKKY